MSTSVEVKNRHQVTEDFSTSKHQPAMILIGKKFFPATRRRTRGGIRDHYDKEKRWCPMEEKKTNQPAVPASPTNQSGNPTIDNVLLDVKQVARLLNTSVASVYGMTRQRCRRRYPESIIPHYKLPCGLRFKRDAVLAWVSLFRTGRAR
jgi:hypothetical protein